MPKTISVTYKKKLDDRLFYINNMNSLFRKPVYQSMFIGLVTLLSDDLLKVLNEKSFELRAINDDMIKMTKILLFIDERIE